MTPDDTLSSTADMSGNYLAAAIHPLLLSAFTDGDTSDNTSSGSASGDQASSDNASADNGNADNSSNSTMADNHVDVWDESDAKTIVVLSLISFMFLNHLIV